MSNASEVQVTIAGGLAEVDRGGPAFNMIPKTGGNSFAGSYFGSIAGKWAQGSNIDDTLRSYGFTDQAALIRNWDTNFAFSGPILRDRIWFYSNVRTVGTYQDSPNLYGNANVSNPNNWTYVADPNVKVRNATSKKIGATRLTWQASQRNKFGFYIDYTKNCSGSSVSQDGGQCRAPGDGWTASGPGIGPGVPTTSPESGTIWDARAKIMQANYTSPISSRVFVEAGISSFWTEWGDIRPAGAATNQIAVTEQSTTAGTPTSNFIYHGWPTTSGTIQQNMQFRGTLSYVTGSNTMKFGYQGAYMVAKTPTFIGQQISYRFNNGVPNQLTERLGESMTSNRVLPTALYAQDQWTRGRLALQGGLRYEHVTSFFPAGENGIVQATAFGPAFTFPRTDGVRGYNDITPRMGGSYDLFGNGKTAIKVSISKYLQASYAGDVYTINNPAVTLVTTTSRSWSDTTYPIGDSRRGNFVADCDFLNPATNGECGAWTNLNWGQQAAGTTVNPDALQGWNKRNYDWQFSGGIQHEIVSRVSIDVNYSRRWWGNFYVTQNRALTAADYDEVALTAPQDPRLPGGGGYPVAFLVRNNRQALGVSDPYYTSDKDFGDETHYWHGVDVTLNARLRNGLSLQGGTSTGRGVNNTCDVLAGRFGRPMTPTTTVGTTTTAAIGVINGQPACASTEPWLTSARGLVSVHDSQGRRARERDPALAAERPAGRRRRDGRGVARRELPDVGRAVSDPDRPVASHRRHHRTGEPAPARPDLRRSREQHRSARREDRPREGDEGERRHRPLQPDQQEYGHDVRGDLRSRVAGRALDGPDGGAAAAVRPVQCAVRLLTPGSSRSKPRRPDTLRGFQAEASECSCTHQHAGQLRIDD